jgi:hypothetical protein
MVANKLPKSGDLNLRDSLSELLQREPNTLKMDYFDKDPYE